MLSKFHLSKFHNNILLSKFHLYFTYFNINVNLNLILGPNFSTRSLSNKKTHKIYYAGPRPSKFDRDFQIQFCCCLHPGNLQLKPFPYDQLSCAENRKIQMAFKGEVWEQKMPSNTKKGKNCSKKGFSLRIPHLLTSDLF